MHKGHALRLFQVESSQLITHEVTKPFTLRGKDGFDSNKTPQLLAGPK
jgi:hypothetical protein